MATWRCPHCGTAQAETTRCWACSRTPATCGTCRSYRRGVDGRTGWCAEDRRRRIVAADAVEPCWGAPEAAAAQGGLFAGLVIADPGSGGPPVTDPDPLPSRTWIAPIPMRVAATVGTVPGRGIDEPLKLRAMAPWIPAAPPPPTEPARWPDPVPDPFPRPAPLRHISPEPPEEDLSAASETGPEAAVAPPSADDEPWDDAWDETALAATQETPVAAPLSDPDETRPRRPAAAAARLVQAVPIVPDRAADPAPAEPALALRGRSGGLLEAPTVPPAAPLGRIAPADPSLPEAVSPGGERWVWPDASTWPDATTWPDPGAWPELA